MIKISNKVLPYFSRKMIFPLMFLLISAFSATAQKKDLAWYTANAPFKMPVVATPVFSDKVFSIKDFGAVSDGQTLNTTAFEKTIAACATAGGGKVVVPAGLWLTGPIQLKSNINLEVQRGAIILFTKDHSQYPIIKASNTSTNYQPASPIYGYDLKNIAITGEGIIDGGGDSWRPVKKGKTTEAQWKGLLASGGVLSKDGGLWWPSKEAMEGEDFVKQLKLKTAKPLAADYLPARDYLRPHLLFLVNCENILVEGVTIRNSPKFLFYPSKCINLTIQHANFYNEWWAQNGDAIDISACENVVVYDCNVSAGDDAICMKSSRGKSDLSDAFNLQNILIAGCNVYNGHGGFVIGSNTDGGMRNIFVTDCNFIGTDIGIRVKSNAGRGGVVKDIYICNIYMKDILHEAISFDTYYEDVPAGTVKDTIRTIRDKTPMFSDFHLSNIYCNGAEIAVSITGLPEMPITKLMFDNVVISAKKGFEASDATQLNLKSVKIITPESPIYTLNNVKGFYITDGYFPVDAKVFIKADAKSSDIKVLSTDLRNIKGALEFAAKK
ncbi:glycoside hydrolase family 28 protein [Ferruginibacter lapsinanis]|uniref:glycoside hydrolase family 28 protein n=1 Tax=Ferruginibacter lapsinanis TaxID=563172 RepID=UPI001E5EE0CC|nr:glycoside hydrolase family 28 protein [Ferruginibacter lapsinanis]UEG50150.1 glycoside hydrolase family 28 protein [Ferruginibacter lapsinanis]